MPRACKRSLVSGRLSSALTCRHCVASSLKGADGKPFLVGHGRRVFPDASASRIFLGAKGGKVDFLAVTAWEMDATNPY